MQPEEWQDLARGLDWDLGYADERAAYPEEAAGRSWRDGWRGLDQPSQATYAEYVRTRNADEAELRALHETAGRLEDLQRLDRGWSSVLKLHSAALPPARFASAVGGLRAARFGRDSAWRNAALLGALDGLRRAQFAQVLAHGLGPLDGQFDFSQKLLHTDDWMAVAIRHLVDEMGLAANPVELAVAAHFVFEGGFARLHLAGLAPVARRAGDRMFERMAQGFQKDGAGHALSGRAVLKAVIAHDPAYAQWLVDKWFWRCWLLSAVVTGFSIDYLAPLQARAASFGELVEEFILGQLQRSLLELGLERPWYWPQFLEAVETYHHMAYASAYSYRATLWFDLVLPGPEERAWLREKYPRTWPQLDPLWERLTQRCRSGGPGMEWRTHGVAPPGLCDLCQLVLCGGTPERNAARVVDRGGRRHVFCSEPCQWIFEQEPARYAEHQGLVQRILSGDAPGNFLALLRETFGLSAEVWGKDAFRGRYPWLSSQR